MEQTDPGLPQFETFLSEVETFYAHKKSLWFGITGSWRKGSEEVEKNVRGTIQRIMKAGYGIVSGGALGVDYIATDEALKLNPQADKIQIFLPVSLEVYKAHYRKRAEEGVITFEQAEALISQLQNLVQKRAQALIENLHYTTVNQESYFARNTQVVSFSDALVGFQVNGSAGTQDTLDKASHEFKKPVFCQKFNIE